MATRRDFLRSATGAGLGGLWMERLLALSPASSAEAEVSPDIVRFDGAIEPIVRLIEETPRERCFDMAVEQLRAGLSYRHFLAALFLAGIRNVNPQPPGFKLHCVFVINAAHQLSLDAPVGQRLLPLFWALDAFKQSQAEDVAQGDFRLRPVSGTVPSPERAWEEFDAAMEAWDQERADRAIVALVRSRGAQEVISGLWKYGARDYRNIGHKAIFSTIRRGSCPTSRLVWPNALSLCMALRQAISQPLPLLTPPSFRNWLSGSMHKRAMSDCGHSAWI